MFEWFKKEAKIILYSGEESIGHNHLKYWIPEFIKAKVSFVVLVRNEKLQKLIKNDYRTIDIYLAKSPLDVESLFNKMQNLKTIFYMSNASNNIHLLRFNKYRHIFIGTEYFDRDAQVTKMLRAYDELWLTSQASINKIKSYFDVEKLNISIIGKPQFKDISNYSIKVSKTVLLTLSSKSFDSKEFLDMLDSFSKNKYIIDVLIDDSIQKNNSLFANIKKQLNEYILIKNLSCSILDNFDEKQIGKYESIVCDSYTYNHIFLAFDVKIYIYNKNEQNINIIFPNKYISFDGLYQYSSSSELENLLIKSDFMKEEREKFVEYLIGKSYIMNNSFDEKLVNIL